jgi:hypothetical protein
MQAVDIAAASSLTEYGNADLFHNLKLLFGMFLQYNNTKLLPKSKEKY